MFCTHRTTKTILVVEDEFPIRHALGVALRAEGMEVIEATSADEALDGLRRSPVDLVITDLKMPGSLDGVDLLKELSRDWPTLPVIVMTAYHARRAELGDVPLFEKPFRLSAVVDQVKRTLGGPEKTRFLND